MSLLTRERPPKEERPGKSERISKRRKDSKQPEVDENGVVVEKKPFFVLYKGKKSKPETIARAIRSLCMVLSVGEGEARALEIVGMQFHRYEIGRAFESAANAMNTQGATFKAALLAEEVIPRTARELINASPTSQALHRNLQQAAVLVSEAQSVKKKLLTSLIQPAFMIGLCIVLLFVASAVIIPGFISAFEGLGTETPAMTLAVLAAAEVTKWVVGFLIGALLLFCAFWFTFGRRSMRVRAMLDTFYMKLPGVGPILQLATTARLLQLLAANLSTGISEHASLRAAANGCGNEALRVHCTEHADKMETEGAPLKDFRFTKLVPSDTQQILGSAPSIQQEISVMNELAPEYRKESEIQLEQLSKTLEPLINYFVYGIAGLLIVAIMVPMYSIYPALMKMG